jgi:hypothetical protein
MAVDMVAMEEELAVWEVAEAWEADPWAGHQMEAWEAGRSADQVEEWEAVP